MKMRFAIIGMIVTLFVTCFSIVGCQQDETETSMGELPYLSIDSNTGLSTISPTEWEIIRKAASRVNIGIKDGLFYMGQTSGSQVNISENLFAIFKSSIENANKKIKSKKIKLFRKRSRAEGEYEEELRGNDCVARTILWTCRVLDSPISEEDVTEWIDSQYGGDGVPFEDVGIVLDHYFIGEQVPTPVDGYTIGTGNQKMTIGVLGIGHMVNILKLEDGFVTYYDAQIDAVNTTYVTNMIYYYNVYEIRTDI